jgi:hypothetical protein
VERDAIDQRGPLKKVLELQPAELSTRCQALIAHAVVKGAFIETHREGAWTPS